MGQYNTPGDTNLDEIIRQLRSDVDRLKRQTRASSTAVDTGNFAVRGGGDFIIEGGGRQFIDGAEIRPLQVIPQEILIGSNTLPAVNTTYDVGQVVIGVPGWADTAVLMVTADTYANVYRASPAFDSGMSVVRARVVVPQLEYLGVYAASTTSAKQDTAPIAITQQANFNDVIYAEGNINEFTSIEIHLEVYRSQGTSGDVSGSLKVVGLFTRQYVPVLP